MHTIEPTLSQIGATHKALRLYERNALEADLAKFVRRFWPVLEPITPLQWNWHLDLLCEHLTQAARGQCRRLIVNVPPRSMKSLLCTVLYPCWLWATGPERRFMFVSYADELSTDHSLFRRNVMNSPLFRQHWGGVVRFAKDQNLKTQYENTRQGVMFSTSISGAATGKGCDWLIVDDPQSARKAFSDAEREAVNRNFDLTFRSRLNNPTTGTIILVMQRLHEMDLTGHLLAKEPGAWTHINLAAEAERDERWVFPITGNVKERRAGELLWPSRLSREVLADLKTALGSWAYAGQYQQSPAPLEGGIIKRKWLKFYRELPGTRGTWLQSWDCTFKDARDSDFVVGQVWFQSGAEYYLVDQVRERMDFVRTRQAIQAMSRKYPQATAKLVENKANGPAVISSLRAEIDGIIPIEPREFDPTLVGTTVYFKFTSFNKFELMEQSLANVATYPLTITGQFPGGNRIPSWFQPVFTAVMTTTSITIYYDGTNGSGAVVVYRDDGTVSNAVFGSTAVTGLSPNTTYYFYPYFDQSTGGVVFVSGGTGSPAIAFTARSITAAAQQQGAVNHIALANGAIAIATPISGTASATGLGGSLRAV